jgi:hypothetical protein
MEYLLSLDASSITIGYSIFNLSTRELIKIDYYSLKSELVLDKADEFENFITRLLVEYPQIKVMAIENAFQAMFGGVSSIHTTTILNQVNILYQYICKKKGLKINSMSVAECRKKAFPLVKLKPKKIAGGLNHKEQMFNIVVGVLGKDIFPTKEMKSGKRKGEIVFVDEAKDMSDSYVVGLAYLNKK